MKRKAMANATLLTAALLLTGTVATYAQQAQKCCGTSNSTFLFGSTAYARHTQMLYLPGDLTGASGGPITHLYFRYGTTGIASGNTLGDFMVRLGLTDQTGFPNGNTYFTDLDTVYSASTFTIAPGTTGQWFWFSLQTPFTYNASRTLIVDIQFETSAQSAFGTYGTTNSGRKLVSADPLSPTGSTTSTTWQDFGFDIDGTTGLDGLSEAQLQAWPNPSTDGVRLSWPSPAATGWQLTVHDAAGRTLRTDRIAEGSRDAEIDLGPWGPGLYLARLHGPDGAGFTARLLRE